MDKIKVVMIGAAGKMGRAVIGGMLNDPTILLVGAVDVNCQGEDIGQIIGVGKTNVLVNGNLEQVLLETCPHVVIDFTSATAVIRNLKIVMENKVCAVIGTTGLTEDDLGAIRQMSKQYDVPVFVAPNFAIGAVLMMKFAKEASKYFPSVEIIEKHHDQKLDAPSGTAIKTLELIAEERKSMRQGLPNEVEKITGCRGGDFQGMKVHSIRLPGFVAHQEVIFGGVGQSLVIRHDSISRESFVPGVILAVKSIMKMEGVVYGLEQLIW